MRVFLPLTCAFVLSGCNWVGNVSGLNRDANEAIGAGCRQTGRSLEECYIRHPEADRAQVYSGWKGMSEYMTKNNLPLMAPPPDPVKTADSKDGGKDKSSSKKTNDRPPRGDPPDPDAGRPDPELESVLRNINAGKPHSIAQAQEGELGRVLSIINDPSLKSPPAPGDNAASPATPKPMTPVPAKPIVNPPPPPPKP